MDIRGRKKDIIKLQKVKTELKDIDFNIDENVEIPVVMIQDNEGKLIEWIRGYKEIKNYLHYGYNRITKKCPFRHRKCIGEKCSLYFIENGTGDCAYIWQMFKK